MELLRDLSSKDFRLLSSFLARAVNFLSRPARQSRRGNSMPVTDGNGFKSHKSDWPTPRKIGDFFLFPFLLPFLEKEDSVDRRRVVVGQRLERDAAALSSPSIFLSGIFLPRKNTRGGGGNALTMRNGRCCVSARAMGQARCKCVACTFYSPFFPLFPFLSLSLSLFSMPQRAPLKRNSLVEQVLRN